MTPNPHPLWPLFDLRIRSERLVLRLPTDGDLVALAAVAQAGVHPSDEMPFDVPWTALPSPAFEHGFIQYHWSRRASWTPDDWVLELMIELDGRPIGTQGMGAREFRVLRTVHTGSWLGQAYQGRGFGKEMRAAMVGFAFEGLGADVAETEAYVENERSIGVSRAVGYEPNGVGRSAHGDTARDKVRFRLTRAAWFAQARPPISIEGLDRCRELFGIDGAPDPPGG
jgi:RimJ/RimL family protein N-acetyltransferase